MQVPIYLALLLVCCSYALLKGGAPERWGVAILIAAIVASYLVPPVGDVRFQNLETGLMLVDLAMFVAMTLLALRAQRYWPMWMAAIVLDTLITHLLMLSPKLMPFSYSVMDEAWAFPKPIILAYATVRHRQRIRQYGEDPAWS